MTSGVATLGDQDPERRRSAGTPRRAVPAAGDVG